MTAAAPRLWPTIPSPVCCPSATKAAFRYAGSPKQGTVRLGVLFTTAAQPAWPDVLDPQPGAFTYYADNRSPAYELHNPRRWGNALLPRHLQLEPRNTRGPAPHPALSAVREGHTRRNLAQHQRSTLPELSRPVHG